MQRAVLDNVTSNKKKPQTRKRAHSPEPQYESKFSKRGRKSIYDRNETLHLKCGCKDCKYNTHKYYDLLKHLEQHVDEFLNKSDTEPKYSCMWKKCEHIATNEKSLKVHITYHGYYERLKKIGSCILKKIQLPDCKEENVQFPTLPECYICEWDSCNFILYQYQSFVDHVKCHVNALPKRSEKDETIRCGWTGCTNTFLIQSKLLDHLRSHTKEKTIACPTCGVMFSSNTKFYDHRKRQLQTDLQGYQCSQCSKLFASERLLRDHMRIHINHYKCHLCDMTCTKPSSLAKHIRYRHLPERLFKCDICSHSTITAQDLKRHRATHNHDAIYKCKECEFTCRSRYTLERHKRQHRNALGPRYACHCCDRRFQLGANLTKHLIHVHDFHWPSGHSRFSYKQDAKTGLYHLQVVRYESLEVTQEMMQNNIPFQLENAGDVKFQCIQNKPLSFILSLATNNKGQTQTQVVTKNICKKDDVISTNNETSFKRNIKVEEINEIQIQTVKM